MSKCKHWDDQTLTYEKEGKLHSRGLRQTQCTVCNRWFWPHEWAKKSAPKKPKMVRVKAWGMVYNNCVFAGNSGPYEWRKIPATILMDEKYLRRKP